MHHFSQEMIQDSIFCLSDFCFHLFTMLNKMFKSSDWHWIHISLRILGQNRSFIVVYKIGNMKISVYGNWYWILGVFYVWYHFIYIYLVCLFSFSFYFSPNVINNREKRNGNQINHFLRHFMDYGQLNYGFYSCCGSTYLSVAFRNCCYHRKEKL